MRLPFQSAHVAPELRQPAPMQIPRCGNATIAAGYHAARVGGDFCDFLEVESRLLFILLDIAGKREQAFHIAAALQELFVEKGRKLFSASDLNESDALTELLVEMNRAIMTAAGGVRCSPTFLGCFDQQVGTVTYCNAGHTPAILKDEDGVSLLEATGLPLGLFSHSTHDAQLSVLRPGAFLVLVSKGLVESRSGSTEFGIDRVKEVVSQKKFADANDLCNHLLEEAIAFTQKQTHHGPSLHVPGFHHSREPNDSTAVVLMRNPAPVSASTAAS